MFINYAYPYYRASTFNFPLKYQIASTVFLSIAQKLLSRMSRNFINAYLKLLETDLKKHIYGLQFKALKITQLEKVHFIKVNELKLS